MDNPSQTPPPNPATSSSAAELENVLKRRLHGRIRALQLIVESQGLVLRGRCLTYHAKQTAQHLVMELSPLRILANDIEVVNGDDL